MNAGKDRDPWAWGRMGPWKHSANEIANRDSDAPTFVSPDSIFDGSDAGRFIVTRRNPDRGARRQGPGVYAESTQSSANFSIQSGSFPSNPGSPRQPSPLPRPGSSRNASSSSRGSIPYVPASSIPSMAGPASDALSRDSDGSYHAKLVAQNRPDEALVNMSLILFLQGLLAPLLRQSKIGTYDWSILHKGFAVSQPTKHQPQGSLRVPILTAKTDGCLVARPSDKARAEECSVLSIVEVKPFRRDSGRKAIQIQEAAEMAAWISTEDRWGHLPAPRGKYR